MTESVGDAIRIFHELSKEGKFAPGTLDGLAKELLKQERLSWKVRCYFCGDPCYNWDLGPELIEEVKPLVGNNNACIECVTAAWRVMKNSDKDVSFRIELEEEDTSST